MRRNLSSVKSPYTGKRALWVDKNNLPIVDNVSWLLTSYELELNRYRWKQLNQTGQKRACLWIVTSDESVKVIDGTELNQCLNRYRKIDFPNPLAFESYDDVKTELFLIKLNFPNSLVLHTDGKVYGLQCY